MLIDYKPKGLLHASNEFQNVYMTSKWHERNMNMTTILINIQQGT